MGVSMAVRNVMVEERGVPFFLDIYADFKVSMSKTQSRTDDKNRGKMDQGHKSHHSQHGSHSNAGGKSSNKGGGHGGNSSGLGGKEQISSAASAKILNQAGDNAYKVAFGTASGQHTGARRALDPVVSNRDSREILKREVLSLLNKIAPDNLEVIVRKMGDIGTENHSGGRDGGNPAAKIETHDDLQFVIALVYRKALSEPHYLEVYSDMVYLLKNRFPEFDGDQSSDSAEPGKKGGRNSFLRDLLNVTQQEFEALGDVMNENGQDEGRRKRALTNMKFIGQLFLRTLLSKTVIFSVITELLQMKEESEGKNAIVPEFKLECLLELFSTAGYTLEEINKNDNLFQSFFSRLIFVKQQKDPTTGKAIYSKRVQFLIQDLVDLRRNGWKKRVFKEKASKKEDIETADAPHAVAKPMEYVCGLRPDYIGKKAASKRAGELTADDLKRVATSFRDTQDVDELRTNWVQICSGNEESTVKALTLMLSLGSENSLADPPGTINALSSAGLIHPVQIGISVGKNLLILPEELVDNPLASKFYTDTLSSIIDSNKGSVAKLRNVLSEIRKQVLNDTNPTEYSEEGPNYQEKCAVLETSISVMGGIPLPIRAAQDATDEVKGLNQALKDHLAQVQENCPPPGAIGAPGDD